MENLPKTKQHFEVLDGLRGIAAIIVVAFHFMEMAFPYPEFHIAHGYLAVDFFFCLSGFVIAYAYDNRVESMGFKNFALRRLIRLQPLVILGSVLGLLAFVFDPVSDYPKLYDAGKTLLIFLASIFVIPYPAMPERTFNLFSFNAPAWSLFWEYLANIIYALILYRLGKKSLLAIAVLGAICLAYISTTPSALPGFPSFFGISGGWGGDTFWHGAVRVWFSFTAGMLVYRMNWQIKNKLGFIGVGILLVLALTVPYSDKINAWGDALIAIVYFPLLVALGAGATSHGNSKKLCKLSGDISYPLYTTHYFVIWIFLSYVTKYKPTESTIISIATFGTLILILLAYMWMKVYDEPLRKWLTRKIFKSQA